MHHHCVMPDQEDTGWHWCGILWGFARDHIDFTELVATDNRRCLASDFWSWKGREARGLIRGSLQSWVFIDVAQTHRGQGALSQAPPRFFGVTWHRLFSKVGWVLMVLGINLEFGQEEGVWAQGCS